VAARVYSAQGAKRHEPGRGDGTAHQPHGSRQDQHGIPEQHELDVSRLRLRGDRMPTFEGDYTKPAGRFAIVAAKFNRDVVDRLVAGAFDGFRKHGVADASIDLIRVPGAFEIPLASQHLAEGGQYAAVVALGAVIQGDTDHYAYICEQTAAGVMRVT